MDLLLPLFVYGHVKEVLTYLPKHKTETRFTRTLIKTGSGNNKVVVLVLRIFQLISRILSTRL